MKQKAYNATAFACRAQFLALLFTMIFGVGKPTEACAQQRIALPKGTIEGTLSNGLRYMVLPNALPKHDVEVRLVMRVGSLMEDDCQKGAAHFLEHCAFNGTRHFPERAMIDFFERQGMKFGRDINAFTGFDRTLYWLSLPVDNDCDAVLDSTLLAVADWLDGITFKPERVRKERGVIAEELRAYTTNDDFYDLKIGRGRHAHRMPLGSEADIEAIDSNTLQTFYRQWYVPQLATVVVVGNVRPDSVVQLLSRRLGNIAPRTPKKQALYPLNYSHGTHWMMLQDSLRRDFRLEMIVPHSTIIENNVDAAVRKQRLAMLVTALNHRLQATAAGADASDNWYLADKSHFVLSFSAPTRHALLAQISATAKQIKAVLQRGFCTGEMQMALEARLQQLVPDTTQRLSADICDDFADYILMGDRALSSTDDVEMVRHALKKTTSPQLQALLSPIIDALGHTLLLAYTHPSATAAAPMSPKMVRQAWQKGSSQKAKPYVFEHTKTTERTQPIPPCLSQQHDYKPEMVAKTDTFADLQLTRLQLHNGVTLLVRPTLEADTTLYLAAIGRGGTADLNEKSSKAYHDAVSYVDANALECIAADTLLTLMSQQNLSMAVGEDHYWHQVLASAPVKNAALLFNLVYQKMCFPGINKAEFEEARLAESRQTGSQTLLERLMQHDADRMVAAHIDSVVGNAPTISHPKLTPEDVLALSIDTLTQYYKHLFANPEGLTLILTGNFCAAKVIPLAVACFASMPTLHHALPLNNKPFTPPQETQAATFNDNATNRTVINIVFAGSYQPALRHTLQLKLVRDVLQQRLLAVLREGENIVYSPYADLYYNGVPQRKYHLLLTLSVKSSNRQKAESLVADIIRQLQSQPVERAELEKLKRSFVVTKRKVLSDKAPAEWKTALIDLVRNGESLEQFEHYAQCLQSITPEDLRQAFVRYLHWDNKITVYKSSQHE